MSETDPGMIGAMKLIDMTQRHEEYPQGTPEPLPITLTDEQWNAIVYCIKATRIGRDATGGYSERLVRQAEEGGKIIFDAMHEFLLDGAVEEMVEDLQRGMKE